MSSKITGYYIEFEDETKCYLDTLNPSTMTVTMSIEGLMSVLEKIATGIRFAIYEIHTIERHDIVFQYPPVEESR